MNAMLYFFVTSFNFFSDNLGFFLSFLYSFGSFFSSISCFYASFLYRFGSFLGRIRYFQLSIFYGFRDFLFFFLYLGIKNNCCNSPYSSYCSYCDKPFFYCFIFISSFLSAIVTVFFLII